MTLPETRLDIHRELINQCRLGNRKAQFKLYQLYSKAMFNICYRMLNDRMEAEDILQEAFTDAFLKLDSFRHESTFGSWLKTIVIHKCINQIKKKKPDLALRDNLPEPSPDDEIDYEEVAFRVQDVRQAMEELPDGYRLVLSMYLFEGLDHAEIAEYLGITESTSKSQYMRAKLKIKELIKSKT